MNEYAQWLNSRQVVTRVVISGTLVLDTPASLGNGDAEGLTDIPLLRDPLEGGPLLTGASIAGALRNYLREYDGGYGVAEVPRNREKSRAELLFGHLDDSDDSRKASVQSWLMVDDALGTLPAGAASEELRDGVSIDPATRTARAKQKYDMALLPAGTTFPLCFEVWLAAQAQPHDLLGALVDALGGFSPAAVEGLPPESPGAIGLGSRKRRGLGACHVTAWRHVRYDTTTPQGLVAWLADDRSGAQEGLPAHTPGPDGRTALRIVAKFDLAGSLLVRAENGRPNAADVVHLRSLRNGEEVPVLPGTSVAGAIRGRALRIANTMLGKPRGSQLVDAIFGRQISSASDIPTGSRVTVQETAVEGGIVDRVQNRVKIDRFTGGSYPAALFSEQPLWSPETGAPAGVLLDLTLRKVVQQTDADFEAAAGLLLLVLKDLWTSDLALGGESSVGRGRLRGRQAWLHHGDATWTLAAGGDGATLTGSGVEESQRSRLEGWVRAFNQWIGAAEEGVGAGEKRA